VLQVANVFDSNLNIGSYNIYPGLRKLELLFEELSVNDTWFQCRFKMLGVRFCSASLNYLALCSR